MFTKSCNSSAQTEDTKIHPEITDGSSSQPKSSSFLFKSTLNKQRRAKHIPTTSPVRSLLSPTAAQTTGHLLEPNFPVLGSSFSSSVEKNHANNNYTQKQSETTSQSTSKHSCKPKGKKKIKPLCSFICLLFILSTAQALQQIT